MSKNLYLIADCTRGIYIPQYFAKYYLDPNFTKFRYKYFDAEQIAELLLDLSDPDNDLYWDQWGNVLQCATLIDTAGNEWGLYHDQDLWMYRLDAINTQEIQELFQG